MIVGEVTEAALEPLKTAGFEGVETTHICPEAEAAKGRANAEKLGMTLEREALWGDLPHLMYSLTAGDRVGRLRDAGTRSGRR